MSLADIESITLYKLFDDDEFILIKYGRSEGIIFHYIFDDSFIEYELNGLLVGYLSFNDYRFVLDNCFVYFVREAC